MSVGEDDLSGADVVDATGCLVLPGAVDVHTHPFGRVREDTRSALIGGTTTALGFVDALPGERPAEAAGRTLSEELPESLIDLAFHAVIWEPAAYRRGDLRDVAALGVGSVKLWLAYPRARDHGGRRRRVRSSAGGGRTGHGRPGPLRERQGNRRPHAPAGCAGQARHRLARDEPADLARGGVRPPVPRARRARRRTLTSFTSPVRSRSPRSWGHGSGG